jgi:hypothetical protein
LRCTGEFAGKMMPNIASRFLPPRQHILQTYRVNHRLANVQSLYENPQPPAACQQGLLILYQRRRSDRWRRLILDPCPDLRRQMGTGPRAYILCPSTSPIGSTWNPRRPLGLAAGALSLWPAYTPWRRGRLQGLSAAIRIRNIHVEPFAPDLEVMRLRIIDQGRDAELLRIEPSNR